MIRSRTRHRCLVALLLVSGMAAGRAQMPAGPIAAAEIDQLLVPGVSIAVIRDFKIDWAEGYGLADVEAATPVLSRAMMLEIRAGGEGRQAIAGRVTGNHGLP